MHFRPLGTTGLSVSAIGIGAWAIGGGGYAFGWGPQDDRDSIAAIRASVEAGVNWIDTAPIYGLGHSEEVVARAIDGLEPRPYVFSKCGMVWNDSGEIRNHIKKDSIRLEIEASLRRLRLDAIDLYQIHWPEPGADIEEAWEILFQLRAEGKARHIGVSNFSAAQMQKIESIAPVETLQTPYSLIARQSETSTLQYAAARGIGVIAYSPMKSGLLSGTMTRERIANLPHDDFRRTAPEFSEPRLSRNLALVELLRELGTDYGCAAGEVAIAWVLNNPSITGAIVGTRSAAQVSGIISAADIRLRPEDVKALDDFLARTRPSLIGRVVQKAKAFIRQSIRA
jgi:aryl-alcohol dehydrogenase-like predicted oxidoreductase